MGGERCCMGGGECCVEGFTSVVLCCVAVCAHCCGVCANCVGGHVTSVCMVPLVGVAVQANCQSVVRMSSSERVYECVNSSRNGLPSMWK